MGKRKAKKQTPPTYTRAAAEPRRNWRTALTLDRQDWLIFGFFILYCMYRLLFPSETTED